MARGSIVTRTLENGEKRYHTVIRVNGKQQWKTFLKKKAAEDYLDRNSTDIRDGTYREVKKATFGEYIAIWRESKLNDKKLKPATINSYASTIEKHLLPEFKDYPMTAISSAEIDLFQTKLFKQELSAKTVRNVLALLNKIFVDSKKHHYVKSNPMTDVNKPRADKKKKGRALKPDEINAVLAHCDSRLRPIFLTALLTGMRRGEIFGLRWSDVDWEGNVINVRQALFCRYGKYQPRAEGEPWYSFVTPKSDESIREIDLSPALRKELLELYMKGSKTGLVFSTESGTPLDPDNLTKREFAQAVELAGVGKVRFHDLRHTFGAMKLEQGENIYYVQRQMGHSSIQVTIDIYGHLLETRKPAAAAKTDAIIFGN